MQVFTKYDQLVAPEGHFPFEEVLERAATSEQVSFVGEVTAFKEQIASRLPRATYYETLPDAVKIGRLGLKQATASLHDFVPHISNGSKQRKIGSKTTRKQRPLTSSVYDERNNQEGATKMRLPFSL